MPLQDRDLYATLEGEQPLIPPLLALPTEIRTEILKILLADNHLYILTTTTGRWETDITHDVFPPGRVPPRPGAPRDRPRPLPSRDLNEHESAKPKKKTGTITLPPVWLVCKRLYFESLPLLYGNTFSFQNDWICGIFLRRLSREKLSRIKKIWVQNTYISHKAADFFSDCYGINSYKDERWDLTIYIANQAEKSWELGAAHLADEVFTRERLRMVEELFKYWTARARSVEVIEAE